MIQTSTRRRYITAGVATGIAALAGCSDLVEDYDESEDPSAESGEDEPVEDVDHEDPAGELEIVSPEDGDEVTSPVTVEMAVEEFELQPVEDDDENNESDDENNESDDQAGAPDEGAGHLHVIVDEDCVEPGYVIPQEDGYHHLSEGETETELDLDPGEYDLCAQAGDDQHNAYDLTDEITLSVVEEGDAGEDTGENGNESADNATDDDGNATNES